VRSLLPRLSNPASVASLPLASRLAVARVGRRSPAERAALELAVPARVFVSVARTLAGEDLSPLPTAELADALVALRAGIAAGGSVAQQDAGASAALAGVEQELALRDDLPEALTDAALAELFAGALTHARAPILRRLTHEVGRRAGTATRDVAQRLVGGSAAASAATDSGAGIVVGATGMGAGAGGGAPARATSAAVTPASTVAARLLLILSSERPRSPRTLAARPLGMTSLEQQAPWRSSAASAVAAASTGASSTTPTVSWRAHAAEGAVAALVVGAMVLASAFAVAALAGNRGGTLTSFALWERKRASTGKEKMSMYEYDAFRQRALTQIGGVHGPPPPVSAAP
jgi:hypothetical protein